MRGVIPPVEIANEIDRIGPDTIGQAKHDAGSFARRGFNYSFVYHSKQLFYLMNSKPCRAAPNRATFGLRITCTGMVESNFPKRPLLRKLCIKLSPVR